MQVGLDHRQELVGLNLGRKRRRRSVQSTVAGRIARLVATGRQLPYPAEAASIPAHDRRTK
jgi:hypothetical protein